MILPATNAQLREVTGEGSSGDFDFAGGAGTPKWTGFADAYLEEKTRTQMAPNEGNLIRAKDEKLYIPDDLQPSFTITPGDAGDTVTFLYRGALRTRRIQSIDAPVHPEGDSSVLILYLDSTPLEA